MFLSSETSSISDENPKGNSSPDGKNTGQIVNPDAILDITPADDLDSYSARSQAAIGQAFIDKVSDEDVAKMVEISVEQGKASQLESMARASFFDEQARALHITNDVAEAEKPLKVRRGKLTLILEAIGRIIVFLFGLMLILHGAWQLLNGHVTLIVLAECALGILSILGAQYLVAVLGRLAQNQGQ